MKRCFRLSGWRPLLFSLCAVTCAPAFATEPIESRIYHLQDGDSDVSASDRVLGEAAAEEPAAQPEPAVAAAESYTPACACNTVCNCASKKKKDDLTAAMKGAYQGVFFANDFRYLSNPAFAGPYFFGDELKGIGNGHVDLGGEFRSRYHSERGMRGLGLTGNDDNFFLTRLRLFSSVRVTDWLRIYGEYLYADSGGENLNPRPIEENRGEAQNLFVDLKLLENDNGKLTARLGRQELLFGAQRLISPLDWANTRRTFDGYRLNYQGKNWDADGFYTNPVARVAATAGTNQWDNTLRNQHFFGTYLTRKGLGIGNVDGYYIGYDNQDANFSFHTIGSRVVGKGDHFLYELEGGVQFGRNSNATDHSAGFATIGLGRAMSICNWKPTLWAWYDWASGSNDPAFLAPGDNSFHHLFPLAHKYNGFMDLFGRRNLNDVNLQFIAPLGERVKFLLWYHYFFLDQQTTPYSVVMTPYNTTDVAASKDLGHEIDCLFTVNLNPRNSVLLGYSFFDAGEYFQQTPNVASRDDADFFYFQWQSRF